MPPASSGQTQPKDLLSQVLQTPRKAQTQNTQKTGFS
jgi:hypothetical protein